MKQAETPLYLKLSSIYNKIMQLAIAAIGIIVLINMMIFSQLEQEKVIEKQFRQTSEQLIAQAAVAIRAINVNDKKALESFVNDIASVENIADAHFYDQTGRLLASSAKEETVAKLFGYAPSTENTSHKMPAFISEVRNEELVGYLRFTMKRKAMVKYLEQSNRNVHDGMRLYVLIAVVVGFFLTRGFSRFSRQGLRIASAK